tara:strand:+ start:217 stop:498 length:282 start_codon:yes stop_codon:yes gene_type:complete
MSINDIKNLENLEKLKKTYMDCINENSSFYSQVSKDTIDKLIDDKRNSMDIVASSIILIFNEDKKKIRKLIQQDILRNLQILELLNNELIIFK